MNAGRVSIIEHEQLRTALILLHQSIGALHRNIATNNPLIHNLPVIFPELIVSEPYYDEDLGEIQGRYTCNLSLMRENQAFLNRVSETVDVYDVYSSRRSLRSARFTTSWMTCWG